MTTSLSNLVDNLSGVYDVHAIGVWKEKKLGWIVHLLDLKMADWIINTKNVKNRTLS